MAAPQPSYAFEFDDLWLRPDQQGQRLLEAQKPLEAAKRFSNPQWQAQALYQAGDYNGAAERFAQGYSATDHYNRGNALAKAGELEAAIDAYEQALERQADLLPAKQNKALVEQALQQRQQQQQQKQDQQQSNKDQQPQDSQSSQQQQQQNQTGEQAQKPGEPAPDAKSPQEPGEPKEQQPSAANPPAEKPANDAADKNQAKQPTEPAKAQNPADQQTPKPGEQTDKPQADAQGKSASNADKDPGQPSDDLEGTAAKPLDTEQRQALEQWLRQIPDQPGELLRRKFWYEQQQRQEQSR